MKLLLRTAYTDVTKVELPDDAIEFKSVRGFEGIKEATVNVGGTDVNVVAASSLGCARKLMDELRADIAAGRAPKYHIIEIMACPGGCVAGGGQPFHGGDYEKLKQEVLDYMQSMLISLNVNLIKTKILKNYMLSSWEKEADTTLILIYIRIILIEVIHMQKKIQKKLP